MPGKPRHKGGSPESLANREGASARIRSKNRPNRLIRSRAVNDLKVVGLSVVKNEGDVIEAFVRHNLRYLDYLFILDNDSVDETGKILLKLRQEGLPVWSFHDSIPAHAQSDKISCLLRHVQSLFRPSFAVFLDADEFIRCPSRAEFNRLLHGIQPLQYGLVPWHTFVRTPWDRGSGNSDDVLRTFHYRRRLERPQYYKCILRTDGLASVDVRVGFGSHNITDP